MIERKRTKEELAEIKNGYIPAPYELEPGENINDIYLEPVIFHNENGPDIGVTTCGVIVKDGLYFKDMDGSKELAPYKDWRLDDETRAKDMVKHMTLKQQAGFVLNSLMNNPEVMTRAEATDENGKLVFSKIYKKHNPNEKLPEGPLKGLGFFADDNDVLQYRIAAGVYRSDMRAEAAMVALYHNAATQMLEYEGVKDGGVAIPYTLHTNPINIGYPDFLGVGAATMGDGNCEFLREMIDADRKMMKACGINVIYGPQIDVATDPRWPRVSGTYGERPDVTCQITKELVAGYQNGEDGLNEGSMVLTIKHFPGDGPSENGFEPHVPIGQWRLYPTPGSFENYHIPPFVTACELKGSAIMPDYSRIGADGRSAVQTFRGKPISTEEVPSTYCKWLITDLLRGELGFEGYVNTDTGVTAVQIYGVEDKTVPERCAMIISAGADVIGSNNTDTLAIMEAVETGLLPKEDLDQANYRRILSLFKTKRIDNPYLDPEHANKVREEEFDKAKANAYVANQKEVVLAKNHDNVLPMKKGAKVYVETFRGDNPGGALMAQAIGAGAAPPDENAIFYKQLTDKFKERGYILVDNPEEADYAYLHCWPINHNIIFVQTIMPVIDLVENCPVDERETNVSQKKTGKKVNVSTLNGIDRIPEIAEKVHAHGGKVIATVVVHQPWILQKLEPYCDGITFQYTTSPVALNNALGAQLDVLSGDYNPTGKMSLTMVSCPEVIAIQEKEIDGVMREVCVSPNDVPGYDKDQYIDPAILAQVKGGSYAYQDADGNYYRSGFGLSY